MKSVNIKAFIGMLVAVSFLLGCGDGTVGGVKTPPWNIPDSLVIWYDFEETSGSEAINNMGDFLHATIYGASRVNGKVGNALEFGPPAVRLQISSVYPFLEFEEGSLTIEAWVKLNTIDASSTYHILGDDGTGLKTMRLQISSGRIELLLHDRTTWQVAITGSQSLSVNTWHYIAVTVDGTYIKTYIDGVEDNSRTATYTIEPMYNSWDVGAKYSGGGSFSNQFPGIIDELMVSNFAKSAQDIEDYYLATQ